MLENWINPKPAKSFIKDQIAMKDSCFTQDAEFNKSNTYTPIALLGSGDMIHLIRSEFYKLDFSSFSMVNITDLGDVRNNDPSFMTAAYQELISQGILPIVLDTSPNTSIAVANALKVLDIDNNQGIISSRTDVRFRTFGLFSRLLVEEKINRLSLVGYQKHFANPISQNIPHLDIAGLMSLGKLRDRFSDVEPIFRDLTTLHLDTASIRSSDSPGLTHQSSIGLTSEEVCKLMSYACSSSKLKAIHISGFEFGDHPNLGAELLAIVIWYAMHGRQNSEQYPHSTSDMNKYIVELSMLENKLQFWKNQNSERWWVEVPNSDAKDSLIPCSENEYKMACNDKISDRLFLLLTSR